MVIFRIALCAQARDFADIFIPERTHAANWTAPFDSCNFWHTMSMVFKVRSHKKNVIRGQRREGAVHHSA